MPELPDRLTRWSVDRHYTELVGELMRERGVTPSEVSEDAHARMVAQFEERNPGTKPPDYIANLGQQTEEL